MQIESGYIPYYTCGFTYLIPSKAALLSVSFSRKDARIFWNSSTVSKPPPVQGSRYFAVRRGYWPAALAAMGGEA